MFNWAYRPKKNTDSKGQEKKPVKKGSAKPANGFGLFRRRGGRASLQETFRQIDNSGLDRNKRAVAKQVFEKYHHEREVGRNKHITHEEANEALKEMKSNRNLRFHDWEIDKIKDSFK